MWMTLIIALAFIIGFFVGANNTRLANTIKAFARKVAGKVKR